MQFSIQANELAVRNLLADIIAALQVLNLAAEEYGSVELVLAEVMNNIVEHAYADNPTGLINLVIEPKADGLHCEFSDDGHPMPDGGVPLGELSPLDCEFSDLPEGGFGWFLIRDLARDLEYRRQDGKNYLTFRIAVATSQNQVN